MSISKTLPTKILLLTITVMMACHDDNDEFTGELLLNGNVESGTDEPDHWWNDDGEGRFAVRWSEKESFSETKSLGITNTIETGDRFAFWSQIVTEHIPHGESVVMRVKIKGEMEGYGASLFIRADGPNGVLQFETTQDESPITGTFDWTEFSVSLDQIDAETQSLWIFLIMLPETSGSVYFDDVSLSKVEP